MEITQIIPKRRLLFLFSSLFKLKCQIASEMGDRVHFDKVWS